MFKKLIPLTVAAMFAVPNFAPVDNPVITKTAIAAIKTNTNTAPIRIRVKKLAIGTVTVYRSGKIKLHAYNTNDALGDEFYAIESPTGVVLLESGAFLDNVVEFDSYIKSLNKPLVAQLLSYHPNGYTAYDSHAKIFATTGAWSSWQKGGGVYALTQNFIQGFGADKVAADLPENVDLVNFGDTLRIAGVDFKILKTPDAEGNYGVEIPALNAVYRHMMGSDVHNILPSVEYIDAEIADLEGYKSKGYDLILTSHYPPENLAAVDQKISYLNTIKKLAKTCKTKDKFIAAVKEEFPLYKGESYLEMTAGFLYK